MKRGCFDKNSAESYPLSLAWLRSGHENGEIVKLMGRSGDLYSPRPSSSLLTTVNDVTVLTCHVCHVSSPFTRKHFNFNWTKTFFSRLLSLISRHVDNLAVELSLDERNARARTKTRCKRSIKSRHWRWDIIVQFDSIEAIENCDHERSIGISVILRMLRCVLDGRRMEIVEKLLDIRRCNWDSSSHLINL